MSSQTILETLQQGELAQKENLIALLGSIKGSKVAQSGNHLPSMVRGLCTINQKLLVLVGKCLANLAGTDEKIECFKSFVNDFILWFDTNFVVFEKLYSCLCKEKIIEGPVFQNPLLHSHVYVDVSVSSSKILRNPFVIEKLSEIENRASGLIAKVNSILKTSSLNDISFDHVQTFGGRKVSCFFTPDQIVRRTENASLFMGASKVEMVLLNLSQRQSPVFDSLVILSVPHSGEKRSVIYPPFRVNELSISLAHDSISFSSLLLESSANQYRKNGFAISGDERIIGQWFHDLRMIFPTDDKLIQNEPVKSFGLGIETMSDPSDEEISTDMSSPSKDSRRSLDSCHSFEIMRKTLSEGGISAEDKEKQLQVVQNSTSHASITAEYAYPESVDGTSPLSDSIDCFDIVKPTLVKKSMKNPEAAASMPDLAAPRKPVSIYTNVAGSAIDVSKFGRSHNPSFASSPAAPKLAKKKSFLDLFKKKRSKESETQPVEKDEPAEKAVTVPNGDVSKEQKPEPTAPKISNVPAARKNPDLRIEIPKISALDANSSQPGSAVSTSNRTLPSPFAMPSSTSTYFFKPYINGGSTVEVNNSATSLAIPQEEVCEIPQDFKDIINSDDTVDFYITPTSPNSIKVSKWRQHCGKWELLTANESVFVKIVANYSIFKSWLLVFKEEYDETYDEVIDKPLLVMDLGEATSSRQSTALDVEIHGLDSFSKKKTHIMIRCYDSTLVQAISTNLANILEVMGSKKSIRHSSSFESSATLSSSLMSKPSTSSTLTSIFTQNDQKTPASSIHNNVEKDEEASGVGSKLLLDRMTIKLHKQMECYEQIHKVSSWKSVAMYSLTISHSIDASQEGYYHFDMNIKEEADEEKLEEYSWSFKDDEVSNYIERIGRAAMLVKASNADIYMLECRGKKELKRLIELF